MTSGWQMKAWLWWRLMLWRRESTSHSRLILQARRPGQRHCIHGTHPWQFHQMHSEGTTATDEKYLSTSKAQQTISCRYWLSKTTVFNMISETCDAIWDISGPPQTPQTEDQWKDIANNFKDTWNFPNCRGAMDGKHAWIQAPTRNGKEFYNFKSTFSKVLMAVCNALLW